MYRIYNYNSKENFSLKIEEKNKNNNPGVFILNFDSPFKTNIKENDSVYSEIFISQNKIYEFQENLTKLGENNLEHRKFSGNVFNNINFKTEGTSEFHTNENSTLLILLHGFASKQGRLDNYYTFMKNMLLNGISCAFMHMPYHLSRTPSGEKSGQKLIYADDAGTLDFYHQAVIDLRRLIDIATSLFKFKRIILCGFSLGSMVSVIAAAIDNRISKITLVFCGGNWYQIHWKSTLAYILKGNCIEDGDISRKKCRLFYMEFPRFYEEFKNIDLDSGINRDLGNHLNLKEKTPKLCFLCDPMAFANRIKTEKILMLNSRFDHFFPKKSTIDLWRGLGRPTLYWFNSLHTSRILVNPRIFKIIKNFIIK